MALSASLSDAHVYARFHIDKNFNSNLFKVPTLLAALSRKGAVEGNLGRPPTSSGIDLSRW